MEPVLIYTDTERIEKEQDFLADSLNYLQQLYNAFKAIGISVDIEEMAAVTQQVSPYRSQGNNYLLNIVADKLLDQTGEPNFNGVPIQRSKLRELLSMPDLTAIERIIKDFHLQIQRESFSIRQSLLTLAGDVISKTLDADARIKAEFTYYTKTDKGAEIAGFLLAICGALNNWQGRYANSWGLKAAHDEEMIPGVKCFNNQFRPDLKFIRDRERTLA